MKKFAPCLLALFFIYSLSFAGQIGITKAPQKTNNTNVFNESLQPLFVLPDGVSIEIIGEIDLNIPYTEGKYVKVKILEGEHKDKIGIIGRECISQQ